MNFRRTKAVAYKEVLHILRDSRSLYMALAIPLLLLLLFGYALSLDVDRVPTLILDQDRTESSRALVEQMAGSRYFRLLAPAESYRDIERSLDRNQALLGVVIPANFSADLRANRTAKVQILADGSDSNTANIAIGYAESLIALYSAEVQTKARERIGAPEITGIDPRIRVIFNSDLKSRNYIVPGLIAVILMMVSSVLTSLCVAREWESGTMEQLLSTPLRPAEFLIGKLAAYFAVGMIDMVIAIVTGLWLFDVPLRGSPILLVVSAAIFCFGALCWGIMLSTVTRNQVLAYQLSMLTSFLPAFLLSGFIYSLENMPQMIQLVSRTVPARYLVTILKGVFLKGIGPSLLIGELAALVLYSVLIFIYAQNKMRQKVA
ncbi:MAG: ABC transporter permease [Bryobacter sp.]|nr:ABC transporter permease [Bryobacter sp.]